MLKLLSTVFLLTLILADRAFCQRYWLVSVTNGVNNLIATRYSETDRPYYLPAPASITLGKSFGNNYASLYSRIETSVAAGTVIGAGLRVYSANKYKVSFLRLFADFYAGLIPIPAIPATRGKRNRGCTLAALGISYSIKGGQALELSLGFYENASLFDGQGRMHTYGAIGYAAFLPVSTRVKSLRKKHRAITNCPFSFD